MTSRRGDRLHVWHLGKFYPPACGGIETHVRELAHGQTALGAAVRVVCVNHRAADARDVTWQALTPTPTIEEYDGPVRILRLGRCASLARFEVCPGLLSLVSTLRSRPPDIVHVHVPNPLMLLALALAGPRPRIVITHHSDALKSRSLTCMLRVLENQVYPRACRILIDAPAQVIASRLLQRYASRVTVVPLGIDLRPYLYPTPQARMFAQRLQAQHGLVLWLALGRLVAYKGFHDALHALGQVPGKLLVIGTGPLETELRRLAHQLGLEQRVVWLGRADQTTLIGACHAATALWFPSRSRSEGFGLAQVEAMASACPVINTDIAGSGVPWVSRHEREGLTVPVGEPEALAVAARRLLRDPELRRRLATNARRRACEEFDQRLVAERTMSVYHDILTGRGAANRRTRAA